MMFAAVWGWNKCTLLYLTALVKICSLDHGSPCEHELGLMSPFTCKMNGDSKKKKKKRAVLICWIQACAGLNCVGIKVPDWPPSTLLISLPSSELLLASFKEFTSKAFGRHRTARLTLEFPASASQPLSYYSLKAQPKVSCVHGGCGGCIYPSFVLCSKRGKCQWKVGTSSSGRTNFKFSCGEGFRVSSPPPLNIGLAL